MRSAGLSRSAENTCCSTSLDVVTEALHGRLVVVDDLVEDRVEDCARAAADEVGSLIDAAADLPERACRPWRTERTKVG